jgi:glycerol-3-phosphate dehydrogenase
MPWHKHLSQKQINEIAPSLRHDLVTGAIKYFDAQVDDARHTMSVARTAARHGAIIATQVSAERRLRLKHAPQLCVLAYGAINYMHVLN